MGAAFDENDLMQAAYVGAAAAGIGYLLGMPMVDSYTTAFPLWAKFGVAGSGGYLAAQFVQRMQTSS